MNISEYSAHRRSLETQQHSKRGDETLANVSQM